MKPFSVDIDDVLADLATRLHECLSSRYPQVKSVDQWRDFNLAKLFSLDYDDFLAHIVEDKLIETADPLPGAQQAMHRINQSGGQIVLITSRGYYPGAEDATVKWLNRHDIPFDDLIIVPHGKTKAEAARNRYPKGFCYMIDDHADNLITMKNAGMVSNTILIDKPWNQHRLEYRHGSSRFSGICDFVDHLQRESSSNAKYDACHAQGMAM